MWRTLCGGRVLRGADWDLFREGLEVTWDQVEMGIEVDDPFKVGIAAVDELPPNQQLAMLALVGRALRDEDVPCPDLTAHGEGTIAAVYRVITTVVDMEIDGDIDAEPGDRAHWRGLVLAAGRRCREVRDERELEILAVHSEAAPPAAQGPGGGDEHGDLAGSGPLDPTSEDAEAWEALIDYIAQTTLWGDNDFEAWHRALDARPQAGEEECDYFGIDEGYFTAIAPDPTDEELDEIRRTLGELCDRPEPVELPPQEGMIDLHHHIEFGPCDAEQRSRERACPLVQEVGVDADSEFDCTYAEWAEHFRPATHAAAPEPPICSRDPKEILEPAELAAAAEADRTRESIVLPGDERVEWRGGAWVIGAMTGYYLCLAEDPRWGRDDPEMPALRFLTASEAWSAWKQAEALWSARSARREAAMRRLGPRE